MRGLPRVEGREGRQRAVEGQQIDGRSRVGDERVLQGHLDPIAAPFRGAAGPRPLHQQAPHPDRGDGEEVRSALPALRPVPGQPQIRLVDEIGGLHALGAFLPDVAAGETAELFVDDRHEVGDGAAVARLQAVDEPVDGGRRERDGGIRVIHGDRGPARAAAGGAAFGREG